MDAIRKDTTVKLSPEDHDIVKDIALTQTRTVKGVVSVAVREYKNKIIKRRKHESQ